MEKQAESLRVALEGSSDISAGEAALIGAAIAGVAALAAAFLTAWLESKREEKRDKRAARQARAAQITEQLSGLYGPLRLLTAQSAALAEKLRVGKDKPDEWRLLDNLDVVKTPGPDKAIVEQIVEVNGEIEKRVLSNAGLLKDGVVPDSFVDFLGHYRQLKIAVTDSMEGHETQAVTGKKFEVYPRNFDTDVKTAYEALNAERAGLTA